MSNGNLPAPHLFHFDKNIKDGEEAKKNLLHGILLFTHSVRFAALIACFFLIDVL